MSGCAQVLATGLAAFLAVACRRLHIFAVRRWAGRAATGCACLVLGAATACSPIATRAGLPAAFLVVSPAAAQTATGASGRPLPRFVSLKSDRVNLRQGPGTDYPTSWVFRRAGLPLEVVKEFEAWRQVRDAEGTTGWVLQSLLSGRRTALVLPWERKPDKQPVLVSVMEGDSASTRVLVRVEAGVIASVHSCDGRWCDVTIESFRGYIEQNKLWGIYPGEVLK